MKTPGSFITESMAALAEAVGRIEYKGWAIQVEREFPGPRINVMVLAPGSKSWTTIKKNVANATAAITFAKLHIDHAANARSPSTENIDNISREQAQAEGEEFLRIIGLTEDAQTDQDFIRGVRSQLQDLSMKCHHYHPTAPEAKKELLKVEALLDQARKILFDIQ